MTTWKEKLAGRTDTQIAEEIDVFEMQMALRRTGKLEEKVFAETRLRRGCYGQRYDNGHRHDGIRSQELSFPSDTTKGPETFWDAPGMQRIKIPFGGVTSDQLDSLAEVAEEYSDSVLHVTTRQDFQLHYVHIEDTPSLMRRLAAVGVTTREACGNSVRNVTTCPLAGVCRGEVYDVTPYAKACSKFLLGHPDTQGFGRKFKIAFSGCKHEACGLTSMHDMGCIAVKRFENGKERRGFELYVGGGFGGVAPQTKTFDEIFSGEKIFPVAPAILPAFSPFGGTKKPAAARTKIS